MTALTQNKPRDFQGAVERNELPLADSTTVYEGAAVGVNALTGRVRSLVAGDALAGFAHQRTTSIGLAAGFPPQPLRLVSAGDVVLPVGGLSAASLGAAVYATDDDTFSIIEAGTLVGSVARVVSSTLAVVRFATLRPQPAVRILCNKTGALTHTGGSGARTVMHEVPVPDGWLSDYRVSLHMRLGVNYTNSANNKKFGVAIGASAGAAVDILERTVTTTASYPEYYDIQRDAANTSRLRMNMPNNYRVWGTAPGSGATIGTLLSASIDPDATGLRLFFFAQLATVSESIVFERIYVMLERGES